MKIMKNNFEADTEPTGTMGQMGRQDRRTSGQKDDGTTTVNNRRPDGGDMEGERHREPSWRANALQINVVVP